MIRQGHLSAEDSAAIAVAALHAVLAQSGSGPLRWLAQQVVGNTQHVFRILWDAWRGHEDAPVLNIRALLVERWPELRDYLATLTRRYDEQYEAMRRLAQPQSNLIRTAGLREQLQEG
jgi:hypothetical protein